MKKIIYTLLLSICSIQVSFGQEFLLKDKEMMKTAEIAVNHMYNFDFTNAQIYYNKLYSKYPNHPVVPFTKAMMVYWKNSPINVGSAEYKDYSDLLTKAIDLCDKRFSNDENDLEASFFGLAARGLLMMDYSTDGQYSKVIGLGKDAYRLLKIGNENVGTFNEFKFTAGIYNYYREKYPEMYPVYKPFMYFFMSGDMKLGLEQLHQASVENVFTKKESAYFLNHIYLWYEKRPISAINIGYQLIKESPNNLFYRTLYIESLFQGDKLELAEKHIDILKDYDLSRNPYYPFALNVFQGMLAEKKDKNSTLAKKFYEKAILDSDKVGKVSTNLTPYAYLGLSRIYEASGDSSTAKDFEKKAKKAAYYPSKLK